MKYLLKRNTAKLSAVQLLFFLLTIFTVNKVLATPDAEKVVSTNAHEGPVCVTTHNRLYFATKPTFQQGVTPHTSIMYLDLATQKVHTFIADANMTNGMWLAPGGQALLAA